MTTKAGYWIGGGLIACSVIGAILWGITSFVRIDDTGLIVATSIRRSRRRAAAASPPNPFGT